MSNKINIWRVGSVVQSNPESYNPSTIYSSLETDSDKRTTGGIFNGSTLSDIRKGTVIVNSDSDPVSTVDLLTGLEAYYRFQNSLSDSSGNAKTLIESAGATAYATGKIGNGYFGVEGNTNAYNDSFAIADNIISIAGWFKTVDTKDSYVQVYNTGKNFSLGIEEVSGNQNAYLVISAGTTTTSADLTAGEWHHIAMTVSGADEIVKFYVNGVLSDTTTLYGAANWFEVDAIVTAASSVSGGIDELAIYSIVLTEEQILALYNDGVGFDPTA